MLNKTKIFTSFLLTLLLISSSSTAYPHIAAAQCAANLQFLGYKDFANGSQFSPEQAFTVVWKVKNTGTCAWNSSYAIAFIRGNRMGVPPSPIPLPFTEPNQEIDIPITFVAPKELATFRSEWQLYGLSSRAVYGDKLIVEIQVTLEVTPTATPSPSPSPTASITPILPTPTATSLPTHTVVVVQPSAIIPTAQPTTVTTVLPSITPQKTSTQIPTSVSVLSPSVATGGGKGDAPSGEIGGLQPALFLLGGFALLALAVSIYSMNRLARANITIAKLSLDVEQLSKNTQVRATQAKNTGVPTLAGEKELPKKPTKEIILPTVELRPAPLGPTLFSFNTRAAPGKPINEDAGITGNGPFQSFIAVADGVGGSGNAHIASKIAIELFASFSHEMQSVQISDLQSRTIQLYKRISEHIGNTLKEQGLSLKMAYTTLIGVIEYPDGFLFTHLGDGSAYLVFESSDTGQLEAQQVLLTSDVERDPDASPPQIGAEGMYGQPEISTRLKQHSRGYMWVIATDGMNDFHDNPKLFGAAKVEAFAESIHQLVISNPTLIEQSDQSEIKALLLRCIQRCQTNDDATIAILVSAEMLKSWRNDAHVRREDS